ncbi:Cof-type HAD-IIB family hydrolase [Paenibacillus sp. MBLB4367]|uniref:Cof-type HAD-IIB family hydrolase n=1 Tax=Paenibacillus sp. MBLB4367 TaxID=3384767 RepID=UPI003908040B
MDKKIVFFDIDGTLLNDRNEIPESTKKAVRALQDKGIATAIATGRTPAMFEWVREELGIHSFVSINGQYVVHDGKPVYANPIDPGTLEELVSLTSASGHALATCNESKVRALAAEHPHIRNSFAAINLPHPPVDPSFHRNEPVYQGYLFINREEQALYDQTFPQLRFVRWHEFAVDVLPADSSKAVGIEQMLRILGIRNENCFAFGDGLNDVEMLASAGVGIAMGNAVHEAKNAANLVTASSSEDGIWKGLHLVGLLGS